jgi:signal transduction histidine kinase
MALVDRAAALIESKGKEAFPEFRKKDSEWYAGDTYIFVLDMKGTGLVQPVKPEMEGKDLMDLKDSNGKAIVKEMVSTLKARDSDWIEYTWPKPGKTEPSRKLSYIRKAKLKGEVVIVGSGIYP